MDAPAENAVSSRSFKTSQEIVLSWKNRATNYGSISLNNLILNRKNVFKHLGLLLDVRLNFVEHINAQIKKSYVNELRDFDSFD